MNCASPLLSRRGQGRLSLFYFLPLPFTGQFRYDVTAGKRVHAKDMLRMLITTIFVEYYKTF